MTNQLETRFIVFLLVFLASCSHCRIRECENSNMVVEKSSLMVDEKNGVVFYYAFPGVTVFNITFQRPFSSGSKREREPMMDYRSDVNARFRYGFRLSNGWLIENLRSKVSVLIPKVGPDGFVYARYQMEMTECSSDNTKPTNNATMRGSKDSKNATILDANAEQQAVLSFLHAFCELEQMASDVLSAQRDSNNLILISPSQNKQFAYTIAPKNDSHHRSKQIAFAYTSHYTTSSGNHYSAIVRLEHGITATPINLPERIKNVLQEVRAISYMEFDGQTYEYVTTRQITQIYNEDESYLAKLVKMSMAGEDISNADLRKPIDYFPNNYWYGCKVHVCTFQTMDVILNLDLSEKELDLKMIVGPVYYNLTSSKDSTSGRLQGLTAIEMGDLKNFLTGLIRPENVDKMITKDYNEFVNLKYVDTGHYFAVNKTSEIFFLIKGHRFYSLLTIHQTGSVKQVLRVGESAMRSLFGKTVAGNRIQAAFTRPKERIVLILADFLLQYSLSAYAETGHAVELQESFEIPNTFEHIIAAITIRNYTYIFSRHYYQVFPVDNFNSKEYQDTSGNFLDCPTRTWDVEPTLLPYSDTVRRPTTQRNQIVTVSASPTPNKITTNMLIQIVCLITFGALLVFVTVGLYVKKFQKTTFMPNASLKEEDRKSEHSGSNGYLSTAFNLAKSSSEKDSKKKGKAVSKLKPEEPGNRPASKMPKKLSVKGSMSKIQLRGSQPNAEGQADTLMVGLPKNLADREGSPKSVVEREGLPIEREGSPRHPSIGSRHSLRNPPSKSQGHTNNIIPAKVIAKSASPTLQIRLPSAKLKSKLQSKQGSKLGSKQGSKLGSKQGSKPK